MSKTHMHENVTMKPLLMNMYNEYMLTKNTQKGYALELSSHST